MRTKCKRVVISLEIKNNMIKNQIKGSYSVKGRQKRSGRFGGDRGYRGLETKDYRIHLNRKMR